MKILIIGGGNMGLTYAQSILRSRITQKEDLLILEKSPEKAVILAKKDIGTVCSDPEECLRQADLVILAVKPQDSPTLFDSIREQVEPQQVFLSIMAGVKTKTIQDGLNVKKVIRAMPNLPAQIGMGMTVFTSTDNVTRVELVMVQNLLNTTGKTIYVDSEEAIDASTAISGSGPAYVFYFMNSLIESAKNLGFNQSEAELLVSQTFRGTIDLFQKGQFNCADWIQKVASRGGTTEAALKTWEKLDLDNSIKKGAKAALDRAVELGKKAPVPAK